MMSPMENTLFLGFGFAACFSAGLFLLLKAADFQKTYLMLLSRFPSLARLVPMKAFIASQGYVWLGRFVGAILLVISVFWCIALVGALE